MRLRRPTRDVHGGLLAWASAVALCSACVSSNPYYLDPTTESDTSSSTDPTLGETSTTAADSTTDEPTSTTSVDTSGTSTGAVSDSDSDSDSDSEDTEMPEAYCGDGQVNPNEECDDGNFVDGDDCTNLCALPACGDGILNQNGEECDDGELNKDEASCTLDCTFNVCGDGKEGPDEECDDGNLDGGDGCSALCVLEECGNGKKDEGEHCDDGNGNDNDGCTSLCAPPPLLIDILPGGLSNILGKPGGEEEPVLCDGITTGIEGYLGEGLVAQIGTNCSDVTLESLGDGIFRLAPTGALLSSDGYVGVKPNAPESFSVDCPPQSPFLQNIGGWGNQSGLTELAVRCVDLIVKPNEGTYSVVAENVQIYMIGEPEGMILMPATCFDIPDSIPTELIALLDDGLLSAIRFECEIPVLNEW